MRTTTTSPGPRSLKSALLANGLSTKLVAADQTGGAQWLVIGAMYADPDFAAAVDVIGAHYVSQINYDSTPEVRATGKPLWSSEDGPWRGDWTGAAYLAKTFNRNYITGKITTTEVWSPVSSYYDVLPDSGVRADVRQHSLVR